MNSLGIWFLSLLLHGPPPALANVFDFGANWQSFISMAQSSDVDEFKLPARLGTASRQLMVDLGVEHFSELSFTTFLDIGCGSGLHSLAAAIVRAEVLSVDVFEGALNATKELRSKTKGANEEAWQILRGDILNPEEWAGKRQFDHVYAWGSLHHTGDVFVALRNAIRLMSPVGRIYLSVYSHELHSEHDAWIAIKQQYVHQSLFGQRLMAFAYAVFLLRERIEARLATSKADWATSTGKALPESAIFDLILRETNLALLDHTLARGMDFFTDAVDWIGGYPMEYVNATDICAVLWEEGLFPIRGPFVNNGMTSVLAVPRGCDKVSSLRFRTLERPFHLSRSGCWHSYLPIEWPIKELEPLILYEDDRCLGAPNGDLHQDAPFCTASGRYQHREGGIFFTTSDLSDPNLNGRLYRILLPAEVDE